MTDIYRWLYQMYIFEWKLLYLYSKLLPTHDITTTKKKPTKPCAYFIGYAAELCSKTSKRQLQYIPRNMHTVFALLCFIVVIHWLIFPYPSGLLHWHCAPVSAKQPWWIRINTSCEFIMNDCITTTKQSTTKPCAYFLGYTVISTGSGNGFISFGKSSPEPMSTKTHDTIWHDQVVISVGPPLDHSGKG